MIYPPTTANHMPSVRDIQRLSEAVTYRRDPHVFFCAAEIPSGEVQLRGASYPSEMNKMDPKDQEVRDVKNHTAVKWFKDKQLERGGTSHRTQL